MSVAKHPFLSPAWMDEARLVRAEFKGQAPAIAASIKANLVITEAPFEEATLDAHLDTSDGEMEIEAGHLPDPDVTLTMDYPTARSFVIDQDQQVMLQAFMGGKIKIQGDMAKLMGMAAAGQAGGVPAADVAAKVSDRMKDITE